MEENNQNKRDDFKSKNFIERNQHNRDMHAIKKRVADVESLAGDKGKFAATFVEVCAESTRVSEAIAMLIDKHDNHKIKINCMSAGKFLLNAAVDAFIA